ncbi:MAG: tetratricopeptide repeat protein [Granulosicoccaceae bacterium]
MLKPTRTALLLSVVACTGALAEQAPPSTEITIGRMVISESATLNPMEFKLVAMPYQKPSTYVCYTGYIFSKGAGHEDALKIHKKCAQAGYQRSMLWLSYIYQNGYHTAENPRLSAYWDMRAAEAGNEVGMFNYGLDLLRGYGVGHYVVTGQYWINKAANNGHKHAQELREADYDLSIVTPDADEARWAAFK